MKISMKSAIEGWQFGKLTDNEFVNQMVFLGFSSVSSNDLFKTFSIKNAYGSDLIIEVYTDKFIGDYILLTGYPKEVTDSIISYRTSKIAVAVEAVDVEVKINLKELGHPYEYVKFEHEVDEDNPENTGYTWSAYKEGWGNVFPVKGQYVTYFKTLNGAKRNFIRTAAKNEF